MKSNNKLGPTLAVVGIVTGLLVFYLLAQQYNLVITLNNAIFEVHRFSMFLPAPLLSTTLVVYLLLPGTRKMLDNWISKTDESF